MIVPFASIWVFSSNTVEYRAMMLQSLTLLFVITAILFERWAKKVAKNAICILLLLIVFNNAIMANISYFYMNLCYENTYAEGAEMMADIHDIQDEYEVKSIAVVGNRLADVQWTALDSKTGEIAPAGEIHLLSGILERSFLFNAEHVIPFLKTTFGMELEPLSMEKMKDLSKSSEVQSMGSWPSGDSIAVIDDTLVIKLSNVME